MSLPPIPERKGMVAYSAQFQDGRWLNVLYRPEREVADHHISEARKMVTRPARGLVATAQAELPL